MLCIIHKLPLILVYNRMSLGVGDVLYGGGCMGTDFSTELPLPPMSGQGKARWLKAEFVISEEYDKGRTMSPLTFVLP